MILAVERFHTIVKPFTSALALTNNRMDFVTAFIWITAAALSLPGFIYSEYDEQLGRCLDPWTLEKAGSVQWLFVMQLHRSVLKQKQLQVSLYQHLEISFL